MTKKHGLGRGLGALIPTADTAVSNDDIRLIPVANIYPCLLYTSPSPRD